MQQVTKPSHRPTQRVLLRPLPEQERILSALGIMSTRLGRALNQERITQWLKDLNDYPVGGVEFVLDCWGRNAKTLPALSDLTGLLKTWQADHGSSVATLCGKCDSGWLPADYLDRSGNRAVVRCECVK